MRLSHQPFPREFPELRGDGVWLRALEQADLPAWFARLADAEAARMAGDPVATSMRVVEEGLAHHRAAFRSRSGLRWAIVPDGLSTGVGSVGLVGLDAGDRSAEVGAAIGRDHWGRGLATRAGELVLGYAFASLALESVFAAVLPENARTLRVLEKLGFSEGGACPPERRVNDRVDSRFFRLDHSAFRARS
jgi:ribosomal-protein-alanine N-acetyltransferase